MTDRSLPSDPEEAPPDDQIRKDYILENMIPDFFANMNIQMRNGCLHGVFGDRINESFPLPSNFQPFRVIIYAHSGATAAVDIEETTDLFEALYLTWWHNRRVDLDQVFTTFRAIDPKLESVVRQEFQRLFTHRTAQKVVDPKTGREYLA